jgi:hypothetical protein
MNLEREVLDVLRHAAGAMTNPEIREQMPSVDDLSATDAMRLTASSLDALVARGDVERIWGEGRVRYVIAPTAARDASMSTPTSADLGSLPLENFIFLSGDPQPFGAEGGERRFCLIPSDDAAAPPVETPDASTPVEARPEIAVTTPKAPASPTTPSRPKTMPPKEIQALLIDAITKAGKPLSPSAICELFPEITPANVGYYLRKACEQGALVATGATAKRLYQLPKKKREAGESKHETPTPKAAKERPAHRDRAQDDGANARTGMLRAAAIEILQTAGCNPLPLALHRIVVFAIGEPA